MKKKKQKNNNISIMIVICAFLIALIYTIIIKIVDVSSIGPNLSEVGFSTINEYFHNITGFNETWYNISKYLGILPFLFVAYYGLIGFIQLMKRKSLKKVDKRLIILGCFYILVGICYIFFEKVIINYRPVILEGTLEASYPSSHTVLAITIFASSLLISKYYFKENIRKIINIISWATMTLIVIGRLLSGVHWLTDIIGGILISNFLIILYSYVNEKFGGK